MNSDSAILMRGSLCAFIHRAFAELNGDKPFSPNWHIEAIASRLEDVLAGRINRLIINLPPRNLKSICASVAFPAWAMGRHPSLRFICASYGQDLANKLALDTRQVLTSAWYQRLFNTRLSPRQSAAADFTTTEGGGRLATSTGGVLTGRGGDILIIDDPTKPDEALSDSQRQKANDWFEHTLYSRLDDKTTGAIVIIMQRLHLDDLSGHVIEQGGWDVLSLPAIATQDEVIRYRWMGREMAIHRKEGDVLDPVREPLTILEELRKIQGEYHFNAQYLQSPVAFEGGLVKNAWLQRYDDYTKPKAFDQILQSWDTANKKSEVSDYSVCTTWGITNKKAYLLHVMRKRMEYPELKRAVHLQAMEWKATVILIEDKASGTQLIQELKQENLPKAKGIKPSGDKFMRMQAQTAMIENGRVLFPEKAPWLEMYMLELTTFPQSKHDDQVDSTSQALAYISEGLNEPGMLVYMRRLAEERRNECA